MDALVSAVVAMLMAMAIIPGSIITLTHSRKEVK